MRSDMAMDSVMPVPEVVTESPVEAAVASYVEMLRRVSFQMVKDKCQRDRRNGINSFGFQPSKVKPLLEINTNVFEVVPTNKCQSVGQMELHIPTNVSYEKQNVREKDLT